MIVKSLRNKNVWRKLIFIKLVNYCEGGYNYTNSAPTQETRNKIRISRYKESRETYSRFTGKILLVIAKFQKIFLFL